MFRKSSRPGQSISFYRYENKGKINEAIPKISSLLLMKLEMVIRGSDTKIFDPTFLLAVSREMQDTTIELGCENETHQLQLVHLVCLMYTKVRLPHEASLISEVDSYIRRIYTKLVTYKNQ